jgi:hypothetical protein
MSIEISMYFLPIYKEEVRNFLGEIKKMMPKPGVPPVNPVKTLRRTQDKLTDLGLQSD